MSEAELRNMIMNFRVSDLQVLLGFAGRNKTGKKQDLQTRAIDLLKVKSDAVDMKIRELHNRRYVQQLVARPTNYEMDRPMNYTTPRSNYGDPLYPSVRPNSSRLAQMNHGPSSSYASNKTYMPQLANSSAQAHYSYADVKFKDLPFYDILYVLVKPSGLMSETADRLQETSLYFTLTPQQAQHVTLSRNASGNYGCQILLRFCVLDTSCEQEDHFPPQVNVKVNNKMVSLPNPIPTNRPGVEPKRPSKPVNITPFTKLSPTVTNTVTLSWTSTYGRSFAAAIYIAKQLSSEELLQRLKDSGVRSADYTREMIREKLQQGQDAEIATTSLRGSLICPLGKIKMELPCRSVSCNHLQCFDASLYIQMNEKKPKWICPVCDKPATFRTLFLDGLFMDIAAQVSPECTEVQFNDDGSWTAIIPVKEPKAKKANEEKRPAKKVEVVDIISDSDSEEVWSYNQDQSLKITSKSPPLPSSPSSSLSLPSPNLSPSSRPQSPLSGMFVPSSSQLVDDLYFPSSVAFAPTSYPQQMLQQMVPERNNDHNGLLSDLGTTHADSSLPSTSSSNSGLNSAFPQLSYSDPYYSSLLSSLPDPMPSTSSINAFDLHTLLNDPISEPQKSKENDSDIIPID